MVSEEEQDAPIFLHIEAYESSSTRNSGSGGSASLAGKSLQQIRDIQAIAPRTTNPWCKVCRDPEGQRSVESLLRQGYTMAYVARVTEFSNHAVQKHREHMDYKDLLHQMVMEDLAKAQGIDVDVSNFMATQNAANDRLLGLAMGRLAIAEPEELTINDVMRIIEWQEKKLEAQGGDLSHQRYVGYFATLMKHSAACMDDAGKAQFLQLVVGDESLTEITQTLKAQSASIPVQALAELADPSEVDEEELAKAMEIEYDSL